MGNRPDNGAIFLSERSSAWTRTYKETPSNESSTALMIGNPLVSSCHNTPCSHMNASQRDAWAQASGVLTPAKARST